MYFSSLILSFLLTSSVWTLCLTVILRCHLKKLILLIFRVPKTLLRSLRLVILSFVSIKTHLWTHLVELFVSVHRVPVLSSTTAHRNQKQILARGELEHVHHVHCEQVRLSGRAQTGGPMDPQVRTASTILSNLHLICLYHMWQWQTKCWFAACSDWSV